MKKIILLFIMLIGISMSAQDKLTYSDVVQVDGISKDDLFNRSLVYLTTNFNNIKKDRSTVFHKGFNVVNQQVIMHDQSNGQIISKVQFNYNPEILTYSAQVIGIVEFTMSVFVRDGRYRYEVTDFIHTPTEKAHFGKFYNNDSSSFVLLDTNEFPNKVNKLNKSTKDKIYRDIVLQCKNYSEELVEGLKLSMTKAMSIENDDW